MDKMLFIFFVMHFLIANAQENIPSNKGRILGPFVWKSKIFAGTERNYWIYVPSQYDPAKPACLMVVQDGLSRAMGWRLPTVLDSLIALKEVPVMIGIFIDPGIVSSTGIGNFPRYNRSFEYDALGPKYALFLLEEILPEVSRSYNLSNDPDDRSIAGASSGAICAFNVAWERPDAFHRVFSSIGTYVGLRGANEFPTLIRKSEPKPLRIFLQDGTRDNNIYAGDWWVANQDMLSAFSWAGYEVNHAWGEGGGHDSRHTVSILADALKWLWKDYPARVKTHADSTVRINPILKEERWKEMPLNKVEAEKIAINKNGDLFFTGKQSIYKYQNGETILFATLKGNMGGISFHNDDKLYVCDLVHHKIISIDIKGRQQEVVQNVNAALLTITNYGIYFTESGKHHVGFYSFSGKQIQYFIVPGYPTALAISAEQTFMNVGFDNHQLGYSFKIMSDGNLSYGQDYIHYHLPYGSATPAVSAMVADTSNLLYSATSSGIQMSDQLGRVNLIISRPADPISDLKFGGPGFNFLYASCKGKLFQRKLNTKGIVSWMGPVKPPQPRL